MRPALHFASFALPLLASADVLTVDDDGPAAFSSLQAAVNAARHGDTVRVAAGNYAGFQVAGKTLTISGEDGAAVQILSSSTISGTPPGQPFVLQGLQMESEDLPASPDPDLGHALLFSSESASLRIEDCTLQAGTFLGVLDGLDGPAALRGNGSIFVVVNSNFTGGRAASENAKSGPGLSWQGSGMVAMASTLSGAPGTYAGGLSYGTTGGHGGEFDGPLLFLGECNAQGGQGPSGQFGLCEFGGRGGDGFVHDGGVPRIRDSVLMRGLGGSCSGCGLITNICGFYGGPAPANHLNADFPPIQVPGPGPTFGTPRFANQGTPVTIDATGTANDDVWLLLSTEPDFSFDPLRDSPYLVSAGPPLTGPGWSFLGMADSMGSISASVVLPAGPGGLTEYRVYAQTIHVTASTGDWRFGPARTITVNRPTTGTPFCFGDGADPSGCSDCSCGNTAPVGSRGGCANARGSASRLRAFGSPSVANETLRFDLSGGPAFVSARLGSADNALPQMGPCPVGSGISPSPGLDGLRCVGSQVRRHGIRGTNALGNTNNPWGPPSATPPNGFAAQSGFVAGQTRHFQAFVREDPSFACGLGQNTSNAITIQFMP